MRLATAMSGRGHQVELLTYDGSSEFDDGLRTEGVRVVSHQCRGRLEKVRRVRGWMLEGDFDVVHAVMKRASTLAVIARGLRRRPRVIATDMSAASYKGNTFAVRASLLAFAGADLVVTQTETNRQSIASRWRGSRPYAAPPHTLDVSTDRGIAQRGKPREIPYKVVLTVRVWLSR